MELDIEKVKESLRKAREALAEAEDFIVTAEEAERRKREAIPPEFQGKDEDFEDEELDE